MAKQFRSFQVVFWMAAFCCSLQAANTNTPADPKPAEPLSVTMGQRNPVRVRVARGQAL